MRGRITVLLGCLIWLCLLGPSHGGTTRYRYGKNNLKVTLPPSLRGLYSSWMGWLGVPQYGGILSGFVVYPRESSPSACSKFPEKTAYYHDPNYPPILLVDGGACDFLVKTFHAQLATAVAILIVDDQDERAIRAGNPGRPGVGAGGWGDKEFITSANISIPTAIISKSLGDRIKSVPMFDRVRIELDLPVGESITALSDFVGPVRYNLWMGIGLGCSQSKCDPFNRFVKDFRGVAKMLERRGLAKFSPHYITWFWNPVLYDQDAHWGSSCSNFNWYHVASPLKEDHQSTIWHEGKDVVVQSLLQACFFKVADEIGKPWLWWDYMGDFLARCLPSNMTYGAWCAEDIIRSLGIDLHMVYECVGGTKPDLRHPILELDQLNWWEKFGTGRILRGFPCSLVVDEYMYTTVLKYEEVLQHICRRIRGKIPEICSTEDQELEYVQSVEHRSVI